MDKILGIHSAKEVADIPKDYEDVMDDVKRENIYKMFIDTTHRTNILSHQMYTV